MYCSEQLIDIKKGSDKILRPLKMLHLLTGGLMRPTTMEMAKIMLSWMDMDCGTIFSNTVIVILLVSWPGVSYQLKYQIRIKLKNFSTSQLFSNFHCFSITINIWFGYMPNSSSSSVVHGPWILENPKTCRTVTERVFRKQCRAQHCIICICEQ